MPNHATKDFFSRVENLGKCKCNMTLIRYLKRRYPDGQINIQQLSNLSGVHRCHVEPCIYGRKAWRFDDFVKVAICLGIQACIDDAIADVAENLISFQSKNPPKRKRLNR